MNDVDPHGRPLPPQARMGLLDYITTHSLDEDYAVVAARKASEQADRPVGAPGARRSPLAAAALALFGVLIATAAIQTARSAPVRDESRRALVAQVEDQRAALASARASVTELSASVEQIQDNLLVASEEGRSLRERLDRLAVSSGFGAARGPGLRIVADDNPDATSVKQVVLDEDLQRLVNGLWAAGAEAVSINGQRLTALTAIRTAGEAITVDKSLSPPYVVLAIGDPEQLPARFIESEGGTWWLNLKSVYGLTFLITTEDEITVPAAADVQLRNATVRGSAR